MTVRSDLYSIPIQHKSKFLFTSDSLKKCKIQVTASSFCRRRLPVLMVRSKMAESVKSAVQVHIWLISHSDVQYFLLITNHFSWLSKGMWELGLTQSWTQPTLCQGTIVSDIHTMASIHHILVKIYKKLPPVTLSCKKISEQHSIYFRALEDFVTWVDTSKVRQHVMEYQDLRDDYEVHC